MATAIYSSYDPQIFLEIFETRLGTLFAESNRIMKVIFICSTHPENASGLLMYQEALSWDMEAHLLPKELGLASIIPAIKMHMPDWIFYCGLPTDSEFIATLKKICWARLLIWYPDSLNERRLQYFRQLKNLYDVIICSHKNAADTISNELHYKNCFYIPQFFANNYYNISMPLSSHINWEVCFLGRGQWGTDKKRLLWMQEISDYFHTKILGSGFGSHITQDFSGSKIAYIYQHSKIALDLWWGCFEYGELDFSVRVFNALGCGAFLLTPCVPQLEMLFKDGEHLVTYNGNNLNDLMDKIQFWLKPENEKRRNEIVLAGQQEVLKNHTITERIQQYWTLMKGMS